MERHSESRPMLPTTGAIEGRARFRARPTAAGTAVSAAATAKAETRPASGRARPQPQPDRTRRPCRDGGRAGRGRERGLGGERSGEGAASRQRAAWPPAGRTFREGDPTTGVALPQRSGGRGAHGGRGAVGREGVIGREPPRAARGVTISAAAFVRGAGSPSPPHSPTGG
jgi:hypothetical protein